MSTVSGTAAMYVNVTAAASLIAATVSVAVGTVIAAARVQVLSSVRSSHIACAAATDVCSVLSVVPVMVIAVCFQSAAHRRVAGG